MKEKLNQLFKLRDKYINNQEEIDEELLIKSVEELNIVIPDFIKEESIETRLFVCPDREYEFPFVFEFSKENLNKGINVVYDAIKEYYSYSDFYDCCTNICLDELLKIFLYIENIPIVRYFDASDVELLNVRKLNYETR